MKKALITIAFIVGFMVWLEDWASSGKMDVFIEENENPNVTPQVLFVIGEACYTAQDSKHTAHYFRWLVDKYPDYSSIARARYHLGVSYDDLGERDLAKEQFTVLRDSYSFSDYGRSAGRKLEMRRF